MCLQPFIGAKGARILPVMGRCPRSWNSKRHLEKAPCFKTKVHVPSIIFSGQYLNFLGVQWKNTLKVDWIHLFVCRSDFTHFYTRKFNLIKVMVLKSTLKMILWNFAIFVFGLTSFPRRGWKSFSKVWDFLRDSWFLQSWWRLNFPKTSACDGALLLEMYQMARGFVYVFLA